MPFTYDTANPTDVTRVRYHLQDTDSAAVIFSDEEIQFVIDEEGSYQAAVISLIEAVMAKLANEPDMSADWLKIDWRGSRESWVRLLNEKKKKFKLGLMIVTASAKHIYRVDGLQKDIPEYD